MHCNISFGGDPTLKVEHTIHDTRSRSCKMMIGEDQLDEGNEEEFVKICKVFVFVFFLLTSLIDKWQ